MMDDPRSTVIALDRGRDAIVFGLVTLFVAAFGFAKLRHVPLIWIPECSSLLIISFAAFWLGFNRRRYYLRHGPTRQVTGVCSIEEPYPWVAARGFREPLLNIMIGVWLLCNSVGAGIGIAVIHGPLVLAIFIALGLAATALRALYVGVRRAHWYRTYIRDLGAPPW
jgi:hypothetical protein